MPKKCECCRYYGTDTRGPNRVLIPGMADHSRNTLVEFCTNDDLAADEIKELFPNRKGLPIDYAANICTRGGTGHYLHFEPKTPTGGACFVQITREPKAMSAAA